MKKLTDYISVKEYAKEKQISVQAVYQSLKKGKLESIKIGSYILIKK